MNFTQERETPRPYKYVKVLGMHLEVASTFVSVAHINIKKGTLKENQITNTLMLSSNSISFVERSLQQLSHDDFFS